MRTQHPHFGNLREEHFARVVNEHEHEREDFQHAGGGAARNGGVPARGEVFGRHREESPFGKESDSVYRKFRQESRDFHLPITRGM